MREHVEFVVPDGVEDFCCDHRGLKSGLQAAGDLGDHGRRRTVRIEGLCRAVAIGAVAAALADANVQRFTGTAPVRKVIVVPGKLVNVVL